MSVIDSILEVFMMIAEWIPTAITSLVPIFWNAESGLTWMGTLSVVALAISFTFLLIGLLQRFLHFKG